MVSIPISHSSSGQFNSLGFVLYRTYWFGLVWSGSEPLAQYETLGEDELEREREDDRRVPSLAWFDLVFHRLLATRIIWEGRS